MARSPHSTAVKAVSHSQTQSASSSTSSKRKVDDITIELSDDSDDDSPLASQHSGPRVISPKSLIDEQPYTPSRQRSRNLLETPHSPMAPSLLQQAIGVASLRSPVDDAKARKRKREASPEIVDGPLTPREDGKVSGGKAESDWRTAKMARRSVESPRNPIEEGVEVIDMSTAPTNSSRNESPTSPIEEGAQHTDITNLPTPASSQKSLDPNIKSHTENDERFTPVTLAGVEYRNPAKFSIKPPCWRRWDEEMYVQFAEELRLQFDPVPFARASGIPVEEISNVFHAVVCNPLYWPDEAKRRGEDGVVDTMEMYQVKRFATTRRPWGKKGEGKKQAFAELKGVEKGAVLLVLANGEKRRMGMEELDGVADVKYLLQVLREEDKKVLWGGKVPRVEPGSE